MMFVPAKEIPASASVRSLRHTLQSVPGKEQHLNGVIRFRNAVSSFAI